MNKLKCLYETPKSDLLVVRFEENIMSPYGVKGASGSNAIVNDIDDDY